MHGGGNFVFLYNQFRIHKKHYYRNHPLSRMSNNFELFLKQNSLSVANPRLQSSVCSAFGRGHMNGLVSVRFTFKGDLKKFSKQISKTISQ